MGNAGITEANFLGTTDNQPLNLAVNGQHALRLEPTGGIPNLIGGDVNNRVEGSQGVSIGGGLGNRVLDDSQFSVIAGGRTNRIEASSSHAGILGGRLNVISGDCSWAAIGGGDGNIIASSSFFSVIGGGNRNALFLNAPTAAIGGGENNRVQGAYGTVPGGINNIAVRNAFAAGSNAKARHPGTFVWSDTQSGNFESTNNDQFLVRARGGARFVTGDNGLTVNGPVSAEGQVTAGTLSVAGSALRDNGSPLWDIPSDERLKQRIRPYEHGLEAVLQLHTKRFESIDDPAHHTSSGREQVGLIAQQVEEVIPEAVTQTPDGYRTLNANPIYWAAVNAIQELNAKVEGKNSEIAALRDVNRSMEQRLAALERLLEPRVNAAATGGDR